MHRDSTTLTTGRAAWLSGLWHHQQRNGQPFRKTVVRIPGPSWIEYRWMLSTIPECMFLLIPAITPNLE